jgi:hypothetical protein
LNFTPTGNINYVVNKASGTLTLYADLPVNGTLTFTAGNITTGANKVAVSSTGSIVNGGTGGWVAGNLRKNIATGATVSTFEIGDATGYRPVLLSFANVATAGDVTATVSQAAGDHASIGSSGLDAGKTVNRFWTLTNAGVVFTTYDATFTFLPGDIDAGANTASFLVKKYDGSWSSPAIGTQTATSTQATGLTAFSDFAIGEALAAGAPTVSTQPNNSSVCAGGNTSFTSASASVPGPTVAWERSTDGSSWVTVTGTLDGSVYSGFNTGTLAVTGATASINNYQYRAVFNNVNGSVNSNAATLTVNPIPAVTTANATSICSGTATNISLTASTASTFAWTIGTITGGITGASAGSGSTIAQTLTNPGNSSAGSVEYVVTPTSSTTPACPGSPYTITVTVNPIPVVTTAATATICHNTNPSIVLTSSASSTFAWTIGTITGDITGASAATGSTISQTLNNPSNASAGTVEYLVTATSTTGTCAAAAPYVITVTVNPQPAVTTANTKTICTGTATNISLTTSAASTTTWTIGAITGSITGASPGSGNTINQILTNPSSTNAGTVQYIVTATAVAGSCTSSAYTITVTVSPASNAGSLNGNQAICIGGTPADIIASGLTGSVVRWESSADAGFTTPASIANTTTTLSPGALTSSRYFRIVTQSGVCSEAVSVTPVLVTLNTAIQASTIPAGAAGGAQLCSTHDVAASVNYFDNCNMIATVTPSGALPVSGNVTACVKVETGVITAPVTNEPYVARHFNITPASNPLTATSTITLYFLQSEFNAFNTANGSYPDLPITGGDATGIANLRVSQFPGSSTIPGTAGGIQINPADVDIQFVDGEWKVSFAATGSGSFFVHTGNFVLPVTIGYFNGEQSGGSNKLTWSTLTEQNNKGFEVERSADGRGFSSIGFVATKAESGNSTINLSYSFIDVNPFVGDSYYRLRQVDRDGRIAISKVVVINRKANGVRLSSVYPNPTTSELNIIISAPGSEKVNLVVTDLSGKVVIQKAVELATGDNIHKLGVGKLSAGTYLIKVICDNGCETSIQRFIRQ